MATRKQIEANRRNALRSTGPKTFKGKAASSMNALRHGLRARTLILPGEKRHEFHQLCEFLAAEWLPQSQQELACVRQMAISQWRLLRMEAREAVIQGEEGPQGYLYLLDQFWKMQRREERAFARAERKLKLLQNARPAAPRETGAPRNASLPLEHLRP